MPSRINRLKMRSNKLWERPTRFPITYAVAFWAQMRVPCTHTYTYTHTLRIRLTSAPIYTRWLLMYYLKPHVKLFYFSSFSSFSLSSSLSEARSFAADFVANFNPQNAPGKRECLLCKQLTENRWIFWIDDTILTVGAIIIIIIISMALWNRGDFDWYSSFIKRKLNTQYRTYISFTVDSFTRHSIVTVIYTYLLLYVKLFLCLH